MPELVIRRDNHDDDDNNNHDPDGSTARETAVPEPDSRHARADSTSDDEAPSKRQGHRHRSRDNHIHESPSGISWDSGEVEHTSKPSTDMEYHETVPEPKPQRRSGVREEVERPPPRMSLLADRYEMPPPPPPAPIRRSHSLDRYPELEVRRRDTSPQKRRSVYFDEPRRSRRSNDYYYEEDDYYRNLELDAPRRSDDRARERHRRYRDVSISPVRSPSPRGAYPKVMRYYNNPLIQHYGAPQDPYSKNGPYPNHYLPPPLPPGTYIPPPPQPVHPAFPASYSAPTPGMPHTYRDMPVATPSWDAVGVSSEDKVAEMMQKYADQVKEQMKAEQEAERMRRKEVEAEEKLRKAEAREKMLREQEAFQKEKEEIRKAERKYESEKQRYESEARAKKGYEEALEKLEWRIRTMQEGHEKIWKELSEQNKRLTEEVHEYKHKVDHFEAQAKQRAKSESEDTSSMALDGDEPFVDDFLHYQANMQAQAHGITAYERKARNGGKKTHAKGVPMR